MLGEQEFHTTFSTLAHDFIGFFVAIGPAAVVSLCRAAAPGPNGSQDNNVDRFCGTPRRGEDAAHGMQAAAVAEPRAAGV